MKRLKDLLYESLFFEDSEILWTPMENFVIDVKKTDLSKSITFLINDKIVFFKEYEEENSSEHEDGIIFKLDNEQSENGQEDIKNVFTKITQDEYADKDNITFNYDGKFYRYKKMKETSNEIEVVLTQDDVEYSKITNDTDVLQSPNQEQPEEQPIDQQNNQPMQ